MTDYPRPWNNPIGISVTHEHVNRAISALSTLAGTEFDFEEIVIAGQAIALLDVLEERRGTIDHPTGAAEAAVGGYMKDWAIDKCGLVDPKVEKQNAEWAAQRKERAALSAKLRIAREAKQKAKFEAAVAKRIAELGYSAQIAAE